MGGENFARRWKQQKANKRFSLCATRDKEEGAGQVFEQKIFIYVCNIELLASYMYICIYIYIYIYRYPQCTSRFMIEKSIIVKLYKLLIVTIFVLTY